MDIRVCTAKRKDQNEHQKYVHIRTPRMRTPYMYSPSNGRFGPSKISNAEFMLSCKLHADYSTNVIVHGTQQQERGLATLIAITECLTFLAVSNEETAWTQEAIELPLPLIRSFGSGYSCCPLAVIRWQNRFIKQYMLRLTLCVLIYAFRKSGI